MSERHLALMAGIKGDDLYLIACTVNTELSELTAKIIWGRRELRDRAYPLFDEEGIPQFIVTLPPILIGEKYEYTGTLDTPLIITHGITEKDEQKILALDPSAGNEDMVHRVDGNQLRSSGENPNLGQARTRHR